MSRLFSVAKKSLPASSKILLFLMMAFFISNPVAAAAGEHPYRLLGPRDPHVFLLGNHPGQRPRGREDHRRVPAGGGSRPTGPAYPRGEGADSIPVVRENPNRYMFDYEQLKRFGISEKKLSEGSIVINRPFSFYQRFRSVIWVGIMVIATLALLLALFWVCALRQRHNRAERSSSSSRTSKRQSVHIPVVVPNEGYPSLRSALHISPYSLERLDNHAFAVTAITCKASRMPPLSPFSKSPTILPIWFVT